MKLNIVHTNAFDQILKYTFQLRIEFKDSLYPDRILCIFAQWQQTDEPFSKTNPIKTSYHVDSIHKELRIVPEKVSVVCLI